jgi:peptidoglycan/LPS O-acetylase OafA/YrhL
MDSMKNPRLIQLDILRGIAILLVLGRHPVLAPEQSGSLHTFARAWHRFGWTGVDLFFVLSGFLVGGLLFHELRTRGGLDVGRFLIRRGFKIWPSYYLFLAVFAALRLLTGARGVDVWDLVPNLLNVQNYFGSPRVHTWSLAVEEHFYLVLPLVLLAIVGRRPVSRLPIAAIPAIPILSVCLLVACMALRWQVTMGPSYSQELLLSPTHLRIDALFFGVMIAYMYHFHEPVIGRLARHRGLLAATGLVLVAPMAMVPADHSAFVGSLGFAMLYVGYGCLLVAVVATPLDHGWAGRWLQSVPARLIAFIGMFSYPIYLWHIEVGIALNRVLARWVAFGPEAMALRWACGMSAFLVLSVVLGVVMGRLVERPALAMRDRLFPARADGPAAARPHTFRPHVSSVGTGATPATASCA